jgi:FkbM family methyltransferase
MKTLHNKWLEPAVEAYQKYFGNTANIIIDIGTRDGDDAEYFREKLNGKEVYAFDANPIAVEQTKKRYPNFTVVQSAVGDVVGHRFFTQVISDNIDEAGCSSLFTVQNFETAKYNSIPTPITRFDVYLNSQSMTDTIIDIVKIDVEGFSWEVLMGMGDTLKNIKMLHIETETFQRHVGHRNNLAIIDYMSSNNFVCVDKSYEWGPTVEDQVWINQRFV